MLASHRRDIAYALLRVTLGMIFFTTGLVKLFMGVGTFAITVEQLFVGKLPVSLVTLVAYTLPSVEVILGALLMLGLFNVPSLVVSALLLIALTFGVTAANQTTTATGNLSFVLVNFVLLWFADHNRYSIDSLSRGDPTERK